MPKIFAFDELASTDLVVDAVYESSADGGLAGEPISRLLPGTGNMGGFRAAGRGEVKKWVVLFTTGEDKDWPDTLNLNTGQFVYFGDNKKPGHELHETTAGGNVILRNTFGRLHASQKPRGGIPPFLVFKKYDTANGSRSVQFKGVCAPGFPGLSATDDLVAVWKSTADQRFQNYRATFTVLDIPVVSRAWVRSLAAGEGTGPEAPTAWCEWAATGRYTPLTAEPTKVIRTLDQQSPDTPLKSQILDCVWRHFRETPLAFEAFAARIYQMTDQRVIVTEITRGVIDGGRDALGRYLIGLADDPVYAEFSLEAKCYRPSTPGTAPNTVGVKEVSRLISRIRHRQFGVLVTTSGVARQAYQEVRDDGHPIIFIAGKDIADILIRSGYNTVDRVRQFLGMEFATLQSPPN